MHKSRIFASVVLSGLLFSALFSSPAVAASAVELMQKAQAAVKAADVVTAEQSFKELLSQNSLLQEYAHFYYGDFLLKQNRPQDAKSQFQKILELSPNLKLQVETQFRLAQMAIDEKNFTKARTYLTPLEKKLRREEMYSDVIYHLARAERGLHNTANFCKWAKKLYSKYPFHPAVSDWSLSLKDDLFEGTATRCPVARKDQSDRIKSLQWSGMSEKAGKEIEVLKKSPGADANEIEALEVQYLLHEGEVSKALEILLPYYSQRKHNFSYLMTFASTAARAGEVQAAVGSYYDAYKAGGHHKMAKQALYQSAFLSYQFQDYDGAARRFKEFMKVFPSSGLSKDAKWHLAWLRYLKGDYEGAYQSLSDLRGHKAKHGKSSISTDRIRYWMAMSLLKQDRTDEARAQFESLARDGMLGYYSIAAQFRLKKLEGVAAKKSKKILSENIRKLARATGEYELIADEANSPTEAAESEESLEVSTLHGEAAVIKSSDDEPSDESEVADANEASEIPEGKNSFANPVLVKRFDRARELISLGLFDWAKWDLYDIERKTSNQEYLKNLMNEYERVENYQRSSYIGQVNFGAGRAKGLEGARYLWERTYPKAYASFVQKYGKLFDVPTELVWGIMRAESQYKKDIISPVGALGLMQVMPNTGQKIAGMIGDSDFSAKKLLEPETAVKIGSRYLSRLMKKFSGSVPLVAAGYNAGPHRVKSWLAAFGNLDVDEFVEHIPFLETRNYVKKVVSNYYIYSQLYNPKKEGLASLAEPNKVRINEPVLTKETWEDI